MQTHLLVATDKMEEFTIDRDCDSDEWNHSGTVKESDLWRKGQEFDREQEDVVGGGTGREWELLMCGLKHFQWQNKKFRNNVAVGNIKKPRQASAPTHT